MNASAQNSERHNFYQQLYGASMAPLWESIGTLIPRAPTTPVRAAHWDYDNVVRAHLLRAGKLITAEEAERRVLVLENPGLRGAASVTRSLYAGIQILLPGEVARAHRHSQSALRFIIEGTGAYTTVDGERIDMKPGDLIITPAWRFHDHGNETSEPVVWLDGLDLPLVAFLDAGFAETATVPTQEITRPVGDSGARFGNNMVPAGWMPSNRSSPLLNYPYERTIETLLALERGGEPDPCHGHKVRFINPATGGYPLPTIGAFMQRLPAGFATTAYQSTDGTLCCVVEGKGETRIAGTVIQWKPKDLFVVPSWHVHMHHAETDAVIFSFSDRPVQEALGIWQEQRGEADVAGTAA